MTKRRGKPLAQQIKKVDPKMKQIARGMKAAKKADKEEVNKEREEYLHVLRGSEKQAMLPKSRLRQHSVNGIMNMELKGKANKAAVYNTMARTAHMEYMADRNMWQRLKESGNKNLLTAQEKKMFKDNLKQLEDKADLIQDEQAKSGVEMQYKRKQLQQVRYRENHPRWLQKPKKWAKHIETREQKK